MRAAVLEGLDQPARVTDLPIPEAPPGGYLVRVIAAAINAFDWKIAQGMLTNNFEFNFPVTLGRDFAGVIAATDDGAEGFAVGDAVFGCTSGNRLHHGSLAEYLPIGSACIAHKPAGLSFPEAAALPLSGLTALHCVEPLELRAGQSVLVVGAPGGVGSFIVQLAAAAGAEVLATGLPEDRDYLVQLGAREVIDYRGDVVGAVREWSLDGVDVVIDLANRGDDFMRTAQLARPGGTAVSVHRQADAELLTPLSIRAVNAAGLPGDRQTLARLGELAERGALKVPLAGTFSLEQAIDGLHHIRDNHVRGKYTIQVSAEDSVA